MVIRRIVLQIRVLNDHVIAGGFLNSTAQRGPFPHVVRLQKNLYLGMECLKFRQDLP